MSDATGRRRNKRLALDQAKLGRAQKVLGAESETVERAPDFVMGKDEQSRLAWAAHDRFMKAALRGSLLIHDASGRLVV